MNKKETLKSCPFKHPKKFGKKQQLRIREKCDSSFQETGSLCFSVCCDLCHSEGPEAKSEYWAIKKWNDRKKGK